MKQVKQHLKYLLIAVSVAGVAPSASAAVALDRTRAIFNGDGKSISLNISNDNKKVPYLAQAWLEDAQEKKITAGPLVVTPPVQRLEPGAKSMVRVMAPGASGLPQDRESLFYFNLREIPPKSKKENVLQIALQTRIKLFYRPASIVQRPDAVWQDKLVLHAENGGYRIENPTPYFITVIGLGETASQAEKGKFDAVMVSPKSSVSVKSGTWSTPYLTYINDYGGRPTLRFVCSGARCEAKGEVKPKS
ncbi:fimbria/pilus periplasmic chaperone [Salmonella enterica]|nr:fimbria/pilus periplasmic chaperone [Salmonella enterica subsp. salamae]EJH7528416.1 fimbria/pilus periplasmic chaperone [Salmonella enterica]EJH7762631.1 fimbria/pilus periplasmic chaperone [Salmonella enterica]EJI6197493.1 fimbria/pilus periplasmic chaperone [Salmonella enterica]EJI9821483.1 fimbria/pilus periplasmic chaperone [Salmonella enterica]